MSPHRAERLLPQLAHRLRVQDLGPPEARTPTANCGDPNPRYSCTRRFRSGASRTAVTASFGLDVLSLRSVRGSPSLVRGLMRLSCLRTDSALRALERVHRDSRNLLLVQTTRRGETAAVSSVTLVPYRLRKASSQSAQPRQMTPQHASGNGLALIKAQSPSSSDGSVSAGRAATMGSRRRGRAGPRTRQ